MTSTLADHRTRPETPADVLAAARAETQAAQVAECRRLELAADWAAMHSVDSIDEAATTWTAGFGDTGLTVAGPGAPLVAEFSVAELAAAIGLPTDAGASYLGEAVELRYRLPRLWARIRSAEVPAWRARRIARLTIPLSAEAAAYVDRHLAHLAHKIGPVTTQRLVEEAIARHDPAEAERRAVKAADRRCFVIDPREKAFEGTRRVYGELDLCDALDLETAIAAGAEQLRKDGSTASLDVRRSLALGNLARTALTGPESSAGGGADATRQVVLYLHLTDDPTDPVAEVANTRSLVTTDQIRTWVRDWAGLPDLRLQVRPVIDLDEHVHTDAYEVPDRIAERVTLRDRHCVFPWCTRPAHAADCDHITPHADGGATCTCNLAPLCRRHHRLKTHGRWRYVAMEPGTYRWTSPHRHHYLVDPDGTRDLGSGQSPEQSLSHPPRP